MSNHHTWDLSCEHGSIPLFLTQLDIPKEKQLGKCWFQGPSFLGSMSLCVGRLSTFRQWIVSADAPEISGVCCGGWLECGVESWQIHLDWDRRTLFKTGWRLWPPTRVIHINLRQKVHSNEVASGLEVWVFLWFCKVLTSGLEVRVFLWFSRVLTSEKMFNLLPCPNSIRYSWFWSGPQRQTRGDSSLWPPGTVTKLPSGTSPGPPQIPKIQNPKSPKSPKSKIPKIPKSKIPKSQNPKSPKSQNPKSPKSKIPKILKSKITKIPKIQNPQNPKIQNPQNPKSPKSKIQNPQNPKSKLFWPDFGDFGFWILDRYLAIFTWGLQRPKFWILAEDFGFWILGILDFGDLGFWILGILDFGFWGVWILDFGAGIRNPKSKIQNPQNPQNPAKKAWILDFGDFGFWGFWILDFGILGILDFGDLGFWILDWGFWMGTLWQNFGCYIRKEDCARRTGSADYSPSQRPLLDFGSSFPGFFHLLKCLKCNGELQRTLMRRNNSPKSPKFATHLWHVEGYYIYYIYIYIYVEYSDVFAGIVLKSFGALKLPLILLSSIHPALVLCGFSRLAAWNEWSLCDKSCAGGQTYRLRKVAVKGSGGNVWDVWGTVDDSEIRQSPPGMVKTCYTPINNGIITKVIGK